MAEEKHEHKHEAKAEKKEKVEEKTKETKKSESKNAKEKPILEREYIIPLRKEIMKVPEYRKASKAIKAIKQFLAKHMKVEDRDTRNVKIDKYLNEEVWFRGIRHPPTKIKVKAKKFQDGIVKVELADIPEIVKFRMLRDKKSKESAEKSSKKAEKKEKVEEKTADETKSEADKKEEKEKEASTVEEGLKHQKQEAMDLKHEAKLKTPQESQIQRKAMNRH